MKNLLIKMFMISSSLFAGMSYAKTTISDISADDFILEQLVNKEGKSVPHVMIGGQVKFQGNDQVFVSLDLEGQKYSTPADPEGNFSFYVLTNGAVNLYLSAWTSGAKSKFTSSNIKLYQK